MAAKGIRFPSFCKEAYERPAACRDKDPKRVYYMSMEFLMGRSLTNAVNNIGVIDQVLLSFMAKQGCYTCKDSRSLS